MDLVKFHDWRNVILSDYRLGRTYAMKPAYESTITPCNFDGTMFIDNRETS